MESLIVPYQTADLPCAKQVLVFAPHPDDEVFGPGGTLALYAQANIPVTVIVLTDGAFGKEGGGRIEWRELREAESRAAAVVLGISPPVFWRIPDRQLAFGETLIARMQDAIIQTGADLVFATALTEMHPDHRVTSMAAVEAIRRLGGVARLAMYEVGIPIPSPSLLMDISPVLEKKEAAMACFPSQLALQRYAEQIGALNRFRTYTLPAEVIAAEGLRIWDPVADASPWQTLFESEAVRRQRRGLLMETGDHLPLLNVIICSTDHPLLIDALNSVACLTHGHVVVTVVNAKGGRHAALGDRCGPFRLDLLNQDGEPLSDSAAANLALDHCRAGVALFLDETQHLDAQHVARLLGELICHPECSAAFMGADFHDLIERNQKAMVHCSSMMNFCFFNSLLFRQPAPTGAVCRFDPAMQTLKGWDFLLQLALSGDFRNVLKQINEDCKPDLIREIESGGTLLNEWRLIDDRLPKSDAEIELNARLEKSSIEKQVLLAQMEQQNQALEATKKELDQLRASRSWRITAPLRNFRSWWFTRKQ